MKPIKQRNQNQPEPEVEPNVEPETESKTEPETESKTEPEVVEKNYGLIPAIVIDKPYLSKYGMTKHYLKYADRSQVEKKVNGTMILVFEDTDEECPFYENMLAGEIKKLSGS